ncbi:MAG: hypothetical protein PHO76_00010 [Methylotenera sp.]|nr:hypothetical protein [Methylotenera sp.]MDD4925378.1 hypothetical protein [Methylotenera sp.]
MMGLMLLIFFAVYLFISILVTKKAAGWAKANNKKPWVWGGLTAFVMYNLVFWDWIPTLVMHKYYCDTQAGFFVYKTPEQWVKDNPELTNEDLKTYGELVRWGSGVHKPNWQFPFKQFENNPNRRATMINSRIYLGSEFDKSTFNVLPITKITAFIADTKNDERIAQQITFGSGYGSPMTTGGIQGFKGWIANSTCDDKVGMNTAEYSTFIEKIISLRAKND